MFFDSHCHLSDSRLFVDLAEVLSRARAANVSQILSVAVDLDDCETVLSFVDEHIWASAGVHPQEALTWNSDSAARLRELAKHPKVVAIGEIGLDFLYDDSHPEHPGATRAHQEEVFAIQLQLAAELQLPVIIHNRDADERLISLVDEHKNALVGGVFHCFGSSTNVAERVLELGFHLGFAGIVTFKNAIETQEVARMCPLERMLIETDAPYLAPTPHRGKTNEPGFVPLVAAKISELRGVSTQEIGEITSSNARRLFKIDA